MARRMVVIGLDGCEITYADRLMAEGKLPHLAALKARSAAFLLDNPPNQRTGLEWEQFAAGLPKAQFTRESAVSFDPERYAVVQERTKSVSFLDQLDADCVVFDPPYVDLATSPNLRGVVAWGAHDPGAPPTARPPDLLDEVGPYPSPDHIYDLSWPSVERTERAGRAYVAALRTRAERAVRMMTELVPDWDVFTLVAGELHGASEALWHGIDPSHPLHHLPSAPAAAVAMENAYRAMDDLVGDVVEAAGPEANVVAFNMGGMGLNVADLPTMLLLPELLHRWALGTGRLTPRDDWSDPTSVPLLGPDDTWERTVLTQMPPIGQYRRAVALARRFPLVREVLHKIRARVTAKAPEDGDRIAVDWMPAAQYAERWPEMDAFALPAYYLGRVRVNLAGREAQGRVPLERLDDVLDEIEALVSACRDPRTGEPVVDGFERPRPADPLDVPVDHADLLITWATPAMAFEHPELGLIGPVPYRRTGGHTGPNGFCFVAGPDIAPSSYETRSAFDVAPTISVLAGGDARGGTAFVPVPEPVS